MRAAGQGQRHTSSLNVALPSYYFGGTPGAGVGAGDAGAGPAAATGCSGGTALGGAATDGGGGGNVTRSASLLSNGAAFASAI